MGAIYKRKRRSCKLCKPHKMGFADKKKPKERALVKEFEKEKRGTKDESFIMG